MTYPPVRFRWCKPLYRLARTFGKVQRESPIVVELFIAVVILCLLLIVDVLWLGAAHRREIAVLKESHVNDLNRFRKQFDAQIHQVDSQHLMKEKDKMDAHNKDVDRIKVQHQQELERKINSIQQELNGLMSLSKNYWEQHAINHKKVNEDGGEDGQSR